MAQKKDVLAFLSVDSHVHSKDVPGSWEWVGGRFLVGLGKNSEQQTEGNTGMYSDSKMNRVFSGWVAIVQRAKIAVRLRTFRVFVSLRLRGPSLSKKPHVLVH